MAIVRPAHPRNLLPGHLRLSALGVLATGALCAFCVLAGSAAAAPEASSPPNELDDFVGFYELEDRHPVVISFRVAPGDQPVLLWTDLKTDAFRALFPGGEDRFHYGPELTMPDPAVAAVQFRRDESGRITSLVFSEDGRPVVSGERVPIRTRTVKFERDGTQLEGTLFLPVGEPSGKMPGGKRPGVVFAHGSESSGERWQFDALPWIAARHGYLALAYDKRGTGASGGSWEVELEVLAADGAAALDVLRGEARVDPERLGVIGYSEGGWLAPLIARLDGDVSFLVALSGGGLTKGDTYVHKHRRRFIEAGLSGEDLEQALQEKRAIVEASRKRVAAGGGNGFDKRISYDPAADWKRFDGAVLAIMGEADVLQDTPACAQWLRETLAESQSPDWTVKVFPKAHHGAFLAREGGIPEFDRMRVAQHVPGYWPTLVQWLELRR